VIPVERQINCLAFESGKVLEKNKRIDIPSINIDTLRARTDVATEGCSPISLTKVPGFKNNCKNKMMNRIEVTRHTILNNFTICLQ
jgi:hypothetical protein